MLRLALCGFIKAHQGGCWAALRVHAAAALLVKHQHVQQQASIWLGSTGQPHQQFCCPALQLQQQRLYSQSSKQQDAPSQQPLQPHQGDLASATPPSSTTANSNAKSSRTGGAATNSAATSRNGNGQRSAGSSPPATDKSSSATRKQYTGATTAAQHKDRRCPSPTPAQQQESAAKQPKHALQQPVPSVLSPAQHTTDNRSSSSSSSSSNSTVTGVAGERHAKHLEQELRQQYLYEQYDQQQHQQQQQWQQAASYQKPLPQQQQYKIVQYSRGNSLMLALSSEPGGQYTLAKTKGPASAADLAAFGRTKPPKDGAAAAAKAAKEVPVLLRPLQRWVLHVKKVFQATFLPSGYPTSVGSNYLQYTLWQAVTNFATTANGVLASTFLLYSVGLGAGAIPTAGALNWVLKDGLGQMGTLLFGKAIAHNFDIHSKTWYFMSFLLLSTATGLEIATILVPQAFLVLGSCANMIKGLSWMAGGSTRSVFNLSFVRDNNIADITAKNTSQYIFASLFGTAAGVSCCAYIGQSAPLALLCFSGLAYTSMYSAYRTVKSIPLPTLNSTRLQLLAARYLKCVRTTASDGFPGILSYERQHGFMSYQQEYEVPEDEDDTCELELPSPLEMAELDNPLPWVVGDPRLLNPGIHVGSQLDRLVEGQPAMLVVVLNTFRYTRYLLVPERNAIHLVLHAEAQPRDMVQAYLQACILRKCLKTGQSLSPDNLPELRIILHDTLLAAENLTPPFMRALARQGWQTEKIVVEAHRRRARW